MSFPDDDAERVEVLGASRCGAEGGVEVCIMI